MNFNTIIENKPLKMEFSNSFDQLIIKTENDKEIDCIPISDNSYSLILNGKSHYLIINQHSNGYDVTVNHHTYQVKVQDELDIMLNKLGMQIKESSHTGKIQAQIPGLVSKIFVKEGDKVKVNQKLFILEAMKMENEINSPLIGIVNHIHYKTGDKVEKGNIIMDIKI